MIIYVTPAGDPVYRYNKSIVVKFTGKRKVISTAPLNGGYREDLTAVFNNDGNPGAGMASRLLAPTLVEHTALIARGLGLDTDRAAGIGTAASMENVAVRTLDSNGLHVTAIVTGGIEVNGGRAGDPASYEEIDGKIVHVDGTINIIVEINARMAPYVLTRAIVTATEAKTAAIQELMLGSRYSNGLATGSGTDNVIIYGNDDSQIEISNVGKHSKAGELIGRTVKDAVKEALFKQTGASPASRHSILARLQRFGIDENSLWEAAAEKASAAGVEKYDFVDRLHRLDRQGEILTLTSLYVHLLDQLSWGLIDGDEAIGAGTMLLAGLKASLKLASDYPIGRQRVPMPAMLAAIASMLSDGAIIGLEG